MRLEAHKVDSKLLLVVKDARGYDNANQVRSQVRGSRYVKAQSDRAQDRFAFGYPLTVDKCLEMREAWGNALKVAKPLSEWYRLASKERAEQVSNAQATDASLPRLSAVYPEFNAWLKGDQRVTARWMASAYRGGGLLADEVGTGKTAGVLAGLVEADVQGNILIVCPRVSVKAVWAKHFAQHMPEVPVYLGRGTRKNREKAMAAFMADPSEKKVLVIVAEMLRVKAIRASGRIQEFLGYEYPALYDVQWNAVIVDESHKMLGGMDVVRANLAGEGLRALSYAPNRLKLAVSATPFGKGGRVEAIFGTLHWLWPDEYPSRWAWLDRYFEINEDRVYVRGGGGASKTVRRVGGLKNQMSEKEFWDSLGPRILRRRMEDVSPEHRGLKNYVEVLCEMERDQERQYEQFTENAELAVKGGVISTVGVLDYLTRCRQFANGVLRKEGGRVAYTGESCKIDMLIEHLDKLEPTRKVVISSQFNEYLDVIEERLLREGYWSETVGHKGSHPNGGFVRLDGSTSEAKREAYMSAFQGQHGPRLFLLNSQAGGVSITLDAAEEMHQLDEMYPPEANTQLYGRIFRRGRVHEVIYYIYRTIGTIDEQIGINVGAGHAEQLRLLDGRRGKEYARTLAQYRKEEK